MHVVELARERLGDLRGLYYSPDIPETIERDARAVHADSLPMDERILLLYDDTLFGGADDGFVLTTRRLCWKPIGERARSLSWSMLEPADVRCEENEVFVAAGRLPLTGWDHASAEQLTELLRVVVSSSLSQSAYREAASCSQVLAEDTVVALTRSLLGYAKRVFIHPEIPPPRESGARDVHQAHLPPTEPILVLYDDTLWGSGRDGFVITPHRLCWKVFLESPIQIPWHRLDPAAITLSRKTIQVAGGTLTVSPRHCRARDVANLLYAIASGSARSQSGSNERAT